MTKYLDRFAELVFSRPIWRAQHVHNEWTQPPEHKVIELRPLLCRGCGKPAKVELSNDIQDRAEYFCYEDLGIFLDVWASHDIKEWKVVRLP